jgi:hypothetical protein
MWSQRDGTNLTVERKQGGRKTNEKAAVNQSIKIRSRVDAGIQLNENAVITGGYQKVDVSGKRSVSQRIKRLLWASSGIAKSDLG